MLQIAAADWAKSPGVNGSAKFAYCPEVKKTWQISSISAPFLPLRMIETRAKQNLSP